MVRKMVNAEFLDIFGFFGFVIIFLIGIWMLNAKEKLPKWAAMILIIIGLLGLIIDGVVVITTYLI